MKFFSPFTPDAWQDLGLFDSGHQLRTPDGAQVMARLEDLPVTERAPGASSYRHLFPIWRLKSNEIFIGTVFRRSDSPLGDIQHALDLSTRQAQLIAPIEAWALTQNLRPGILWVDAQRHILSCMDTGQSWNIPEMPKILPLLVQSARIIPGQDEGKSFLNPGHEAITITIPSSRHQVLHRLAQLRGEIES